MQQMSPKEYNQYVSSLSPSSPSYKNVLFAFLIGGAICAIAQLIRTGWMAVGFDEELAGTLTSITVIFCGALLKGLSVFDDIARWPGPVPWFLSLVSPTPWYPQPWNTAPRALSWALPPRCSPLPDQSSFSVSPPV